MGLFVKNTPRLYPVEFVLLPWILYTVSVVVVMFVKPWAEAPPTVIVLEEVGFTVVTVLIVLFVVPPVRKPLATALDVPVKFKLENATVIMLPLIVTVTLLPVFAVQLLPELLEYNTS